MNQLNKTIAWYNCQIKPRKRTKTSTKETVLMSPAVLRNTQHVAHGSICRVESEFTRESPSSRVRISSLPVMHMEGWRGFIGSTPSQPRRYADSQCRRAPGTNLRDSLHGTLSAPQRQPYPAAVDAAAMRTRWEVWGFYSAGRNVGAWPRNAPFFPR